MRILKGKCHEYKEKLKDVRSDYFAKCQAYLAEAEEMDEWFKTTVEKQTDSEVYGKEEIFD